jgi:hypothetical protein
MKTSEQIAEIAAALAKAQGAIKNPVADETNPFFGSKYADLAGSLDVVRPAFSANGLSVVQSPETRWTEGGKVILKVVTRIMHASGQWIENDGLDVEIVRRKGRRGQSAEEEQVVAGPPTPQDVAAGSTYLRRIGLNAAAGVAQTDEDDDGNDASGRTVPGKTAAGAPAAERGQASAPAAKELGPEASAEQLYAGCMALLSDVVRTSAGPVSSIDQNTRIAYKHEADEAKGNAEALFKVYAELRRAVIAGRTEKVGGGAA